MLVTPTFYPQGESSPESSKDVDKLRGQLAPPMNGSEEAGGARKAAPTIKSMNNQPTPPVRAKMVRYRSYTTFGTVGDNGEKF